jgi:hypothetical protein
LPIWYYQLLVWDDEDMVSIPSSYRRNTTVKTELINFRLPGDMAAALKRAASEDLRSINAQGVYYFRMGLVAESRYPPGNGGVVPVARPMAVPTPEPDQKPPSAAAETRLETSTELQAIGVVTTINEELRRDGHSPLTGHTYKAICRLLSTEFKDVRDLAAARAKGSTQWLDAGALPGLIRALFPDDLGAIAMAKKTQNAVQMQRKIATGSEVRQFISAKGIVPGMSPTEAVQRGPQAWLDAGIGEDNARKLFDEQTAVEARRRANARGNAKKKRAA